MLRILPGALDCAAWLQGETVVCYKGQPFGEKQLLKVAASYDCPEFPISTTVHPKIGSWMRIAHAVSYNSRSQFERSQHDVNVMS